MAIDLTSGRLNASVSSGPTLTGGVSAVFWLKVLDVSNYNEIVILDDTSGNKLRLFTSPFNDIFGAIGTDDNLAGQTFATATWTAVALTYNGTTLSIYVNGNLTTASVSYSATVNNIQLGSAAVSSAFAIQDLLVYGRVLSAVEIADASRSRRPLTTSLVAWYPLLGGGTRLTDFSGFSRSFSVSTGSVSDYSPPPSISWGGPSTTQALRGASGATSITASGLTNVTGAAAITKAASAAAGGTTQVTGAATITASAAIVASGTTQVTGAADLPNGLITGYSTGSSFAGFTAWVYPRSNVAASDVVWCPLNNGAAPIGLLRISLNGTTLRFEVTNDSVSSSYVFSQSLTLNAWTHVSLQIGAVTATSYVNGVAVDSAAFDRTNVNGYGQLIIGRNADATIRDAVVGSLASAQVRMAYAMRAPQGYSGAFTYYPLLEGGQRLSNFGGFVGASTSGLTVLGAGLAEGSENPPAPWGGPNTLQYLTAGAVNIAITASGLTQVSGAAAVSSAAPIVAAGTTQVTGAAALTAAAAIAATGVTQVTGAAAVTASAPLVATGVTQVTGAVGVNPTWPIVATGVTQVSGAAAISASAPITAAGLTQVTGAANLTTPGDVAGTGLTQVTGTAALTAAAPLVAAGTTQTTGAAALASSAPLVAAGTTQVTGVATVSSNASAASSGTTQVTGAANVSIAYSITAAGVTQVTGSAVFDGVTPPSSPGGDTQFSRRFLHTVGRRHVR